ncbi:ZIP family metal transporter [Abyssisolibacter fermentans]|uniref:ZIP family metal transporter n=1 Tax=Abyssisolibacter fermentans TaxID=1766203 RepID=UPI000830468D|nr:ZIP family metal transporter [Abyssisolibacter fermentans]
MIYLYVNTLIGFLVGVLGTTMGGIITLLIVKSSHKLNNFLFGFTGGLMLSVVIFELLPDSFDICGSKYTIIGVVIGIMFVKLTSTIINSIGFKNKLLKVGFLMSIAIGTHNLPEGIAIGSSLTNNITIGLTIVLIMIIHNIPEGVAMATPLKIGGFSGYKLIGLCIIAGLPTGVGAFIGSFLGNISDELMSICFSFAGGAMLYIICNDLIPASIENNKIFCSFLGITTGLFFGFIIINFLSL